MGVSEFWAGMMVEYQVISTKVTPNGDHEWTVEFVFSRKDTDVDCFPSLSEIPDKADEEMIKQRDLWEQMEAVCEPKEETWRDRPPLL